MPPLMRFSKGRLGPSHPLEWGTSVGDGLTLSGSSSTTSSREVGWEDVADFVTNEETTTRLFKDFLDPVSDMTLCVCMEGIG